MEKISKEEFIKKDLYSSQKKNNISIYLMNKYLDLFNTNPEEWLNNFKNSSPNQFNCLKIVINMMASDSEICSLFELTKIEQIRPKMFKNWENKLKSFSPELGGKNLNYKKFNYFYEDFIITHFKENNNLEKNLLIGFTGNSSLLMSPLPCLIDTLKRLNYDLIIVYRKNKISYLNEDIVSFKRIEKTINRIIYSYNYNKTAKKIFSIGTSAGALASLIFAIRNSLKMGIYLGGSRNDFDVIRSDHINKEFLSENLLQNNIDQNKSKLLLLAANENLDDKKKVLYVKNYLEDLPENFESEIKFFEGCKNHNFINELIQNKKTTLFDIFNNLL